MSIAHQEIFDKLYEKFKRSVAALECKAENFMDFLVHAMEQAEKFAREVKDKVVLHGLEKKEMVEDMMKKFVSEMNEWAEDRKEEWEKLQVGVKHFMDKTIDILVSAAKGYLEFNVKVKAKCGCAPKAVKKNKSSHPRDITEINALTDKIHQEVKQSIVNKNFNANNFIVLITIVMQVVEKLSELSGAEKKAVATQVIKRLIMEIPMPDADRNIVETIVDTTLSKTIDYIIMAANGELDFGAIAEQFKSAFSCCFPKK